MDDLLTVSRPPMKERSLEVAPAVIVGLVLAVLFVVASIALRLPDTVRLTVDNPYPWRVEVSARSADSDTWTGAGSVARDGRLDFLEFPDQGAEWVLRFSYAGQSEQVEVSRDQLTAEDWTVQVPERLAQELEDAGVRETTGSTAGGE